MKESTDAGGNGGGGGLGGPTMLPYRLGLAQFFNLSFPTSTLADTQPPTASSTTGDDLILPLPSGTKTGTSSVDTVVRYLFELQSVFIEAKWFTAGRCYQIQSTNTISIPYTTIITSHDFEPKLFILIMIVNISNDFTVSK